MNVEATAVSADIIRLAEECGFEQGHTLQVARLALRLYDELQPMHQLPPGARHLLLCGAILHDIGWCKGQKAHHKTAYDIITRRRLESLSSHELEIVALVARYHRKALPSVDHAPFARLALLDRELVAKLSAILRIADGLDRSHRDAVRDVRAEILPDRVVLHAETDGNAEAEIWGAKRKADLFPKAFGCLVEIVTGTALPEKPAK